MDQGKVADVHDYHAPDFVLRMQPAFNDFFSYLKKFCPNNSRVLMQTTSLTRNKSLLKPATVFSSQEQ
ncbi:hypothetical protein Ciccas_008380 [Cichlidogyrus casuarinus]|uniref:Uncharacterized protein n=1 Tax=Cichlidogyrus casuarinus TaxID=1844966 RepID=A0ABD2Q042_9PLAT